MRNFIIGTIIFTLAMAGAQASTIILKDGRTVKGAIIQQDKTKVVVESGGASLTYYKDEIKSIQEDAVNQDTGEDAEKEDLLAQYQIVFPADAVILGKAEGTLPASLNDQFLLFLKKDSEYGKLVEMRKQALKKYLTSADLKVSIDFFSTPEGKTFFAHWVNYNRIISNEFAGRVQQDAGKAKDQWLKDNMAQQKKGQTLNDSM